jgi:hypothetical protein
MVNLPYQVKHARRAPAAQRLKSLFASFSSEKEESFLPSFLKPASASAHKAPTHPRHHAQ